MWSRRHKTAAPPAPVDSSPCQTLRSRAASPLRAFFATQNAGAIVLVDRDSGRVGLGELAVVLHVREVLDDRSRGSLRDHWHHTRAARMDQRRADGLLLLRRRPRDPTRVRHGRAARATAPRHPVVAAIGGIIAPALIYLAFNGGTPDAKGWGIAIGTDTAFALGVLALVGPRQPAPAARVPAHPGGRRRHRRARHHRRRLHRRPLVRRAGGRGRAVRASRSSCDVRACATASPTSSSRSSFWVAVLESGIHPTIAGVALGLARDGLSAAPRGAPAGRDALALFREQPTPEYARTASTSVRLAVSPNERLQRSGSRGRVYVIVPLFALANAGVTSAAMRSTAG